MKITTYIVFILSLLCFSVTKADNIYNKLKTAEKLIQTDSDSALSILNSMEKNDTTINNISLRANMLFLKTRIYRSEQKYTKAYNLSREALEISETSNDTFLLIKAYRNYGVMNYVVFKEKESRKYLEKAHALTKILLDEGKATPSDLLESYSQIKSQLIRFQRYYEAQLYNDSIFNIIKTYNFGEINKAYYNTSRGYLLLKTNNADSALTFLEKARFFFENIESEKYVYDHRAYLPTVYSHLGEAYRKTADYEQSEKYFELSLKLIEKYTWHHNHKPYILEQYAWLLYETGEYEKAIIYLNESQNLSERYFNAKSLSDSSFQKVRTRYRGELNQRMQELIATSMEIAQKDKAILRFRIFTIFIIASLLIGLLIFRIKINNKKYTSEKEAIKEQEKQAIEMVKLKNRELTESTLKLIEKEEIIKQLSEEIAKSKSQESKVLLKQISNSSDNMWDDFNSRFKAVNQDFYRKLSDEFPKLSSNDLKICALLKLNFSTKEMAHLLGISNESVQKARHRLRKKLDLDRDVNLISFISSI